MKQKRRKKRAREWADFQVRHGLSDDDMRLARATGYPLKLLEEKLSDSGFAGRPIAARIHEIHRRWQEQLAARQEAIASGQIQPKKKKKKSERYDPQWAKAKKLCRLNMEDIRKAKELGMSPRSLMKNIPSPTQPWKAPVKEWIRDLYEKRGRRAANKTSGPAAQAAPSAAPETDHDSVVNDWEKNAKRNDDENYEFLRSMKFRDYGFEPDELAHELHNKAFQIVDCTCCANCCKTLTIKFEDEDIERIAVHFQMPVAEFINTYLELDEEDGTYKARGKPCPFLGQDNRCTIYDVRPSVCREYPHTDKEGLVFRTMGIANNALVCPAVFWIVEQMKQRALG